MTLPNLLIQYQCTAPSCSRMSSPLNILQFLPTVEELISNNTTRVPFITMRLGRTAEQSCPFCASPSRIIPVDPSFQNVELRSALKTMFGSFFGYSVSDVVEAQNPQWMPVKAHGNEAATPGTKVQWVVVGNQVHQLLITAPSLVREVEQAAQSSRSMPLTPRSSTTTRSTSAPRSHSQTILATSQQPTDTANPFFNPARPYFSPSTFPQALQLQAQQPQSQDPSDPGPSNPLSSADLCAFIGDLTHLEVPASPSPNPTTTTTSSAEISVPPLLQPWADLFRRVENDNNNNNNTDNEDPDPNWLEDWSEPPPTG